MDSEYLPDGRLLDIVDDAWRKDKLPHDDIAVPQAELPDVFADDGMSAETIKEQEQKWTDLALQNLHDPQGSGHIYSGKPINDATVLPTASGWFVTVKDDGLSS